MGYGACSKAVDHQADVGAANVMRDTIIGALNGQDQQIAELFEVISILEKKLDPVLGSSPLDPANKKLADPVPVAPSVRLRIRDNQRQIETLAYRLSSIVDRVEL
jgi:hypothetical protein